jgi:hypothetical protein
MNNQDWVRAFEPVDFTHAGHTFRVEAAAHRIVVSIDGFAPMETGLVASHGMAREAVVALVLMWFVQRRRSDPSFAEMK